MKRHPVERIVRPLALMLACLLSACGDISPRQGVGALWIYERGAARCENVQSVLFVAQRWTEYKAGGESKTTESPTDYKAGEHCPAP